MHQNILQLGKALSSDGLLTSDRAQPTNLRQRQITGATEKKTERLS